METLDDAVSFFRTSLPVSRLLLEVGPDGVRAEVAGSEAGRSFRRDPSEVGLAIRKATLRALGTPEAEVRASAHGTRG